MTHRRGFAAFGVRIGLAVAAAGLAAPAVVLLPRQWERGNQSARLIPMTVDVIGDPGGPLVIFSGGGWPGQDLRGRSIGCGDGAWAEFRAVSFRRADLRGVALPR